MFWWGSKHNQIWPSRAYWGGGGEGGDCSGGAQSTTKFGQVGPIGGGFGLTVLIPRLKMYWNYVRMYSMKRKCILGIPGCLCREVYFVSLF